MKIWILIIIFPGCTPFFYSGQKRNLKMRASLRNKEKTDTENTSDARSIFLSRSRRYVRCANNFFSHGPLLHLLLTLTSSILSFFDFFVTGNFDSMTEIKFPWLSGSGEPENFQTSWQRQREISTTYFEFRHLLYARINVSIFLESEIFVPIQFFAVTVWSLSRVCGTFLRISAKSVTRELMKDWFILRDFVKVYILGEVVSENANWLI